MEAEEEKNGRVAAVQTGKEYKGQEAEKEEEGEQLAVQQGKEYKRRG